MLVLLQVTSGPSKGRKTLVRSGQVVRVGRTEWADFNVPQDTEMAEVHFALECEPYLCRLRDLNSAPGTMVNGGKVAEATLRHGDQITAGQTTFVVQIDGPQPMAGGFPTGGQTAGATQVAAAAPSSGFANVLHARAIQVCTQYQPDDDAKALLSDTQTPRQFFDALVAAKQIPEAIRFLAYALPKREAVWWACVCLQKGAAGPLAGKDRAALDAAHAWVLDPQEHTRNKAMVAAAATDYGTAASWAAAAAGWNSGSMTSPDLPIVPPLDSLTAQAATASIKLAATAGLASKVPANFADFLSEGVAVADGKSRWPEAKPK